MLRTLLTALVAVLAWPLSAADSAREYRLGVEEVDYYPIYSAVPPLPSRLGQPREGFRKLGFVRGFTPWKFKEDIEAGRVTIHEAPNPQGLIRMTLAGYIDAANMARQVARYHLRQQGRPDGLVVEPALLPLSDSYYHLSSIRHPELIQRFDAFVRREAEAVQALKDKYGL